jgi:VanZ family protein
VRLLFLWGPVVAQMGLIFLASTEANPDSLPGNLPDTLLHFVAYGALGFLVLRALAKGRLAGITWPRAIAAVAISLLYGLSDELHQLGVPGRHADVRDLLADAVGAAAGVAALASLGVLRKVYFDDPGTGRFRT